MTTYHDPNTDKDFVVQPTRASIIAPLGKTRPAYHEPKKVTREKVFRFTGKDGKEYTLTLQQKRFCEEFVKFDMKGVDAIIEAGYSVYDGNGRVNRILASKMARDNLLKGSIQQYNEILFERAGCHEESVDKQVLKLLNQDADLGAKARGLDIYYKKIGAYAPEKREHSVDAELEKTLDRIAKILDEK